jgi:uncharacterized protein (TIGR02145 family)
MKTKLLITMAVMLTLTTTKVLSQVTNIDNNTYKTVVNGEQTWMAENLNISKFRNGDQIPEAKTIEEWEKAGKNNQPAWCYYDFDSINGQIHGKLYNGFAVIDPRGIAPEGFRIPTKEDFQVLINHYGGEDKAGNKLKSNSGWKEDFNGESTSQEFFAMPSGYFFNNFFQDIGYEVMFWSQSTYYNAVYNHSEDLTMLPLYFNYKTAYLSNQSKYNGCSVRCLSNDTK